MSVQTVNAKCGLIRKKEDNMDTSEFDTEIGKLEGEMKNLREQMEKTSNEFLIATNEFIVEWFKKELEKEVRSNPEITKKLGVEVLRKLNSDLQNLISEVPDLVNQYLNKDDCWGHRGPIPTGWGKRWGHNPLEKNVRIILGHVGEIYIKYGYMQNSSLNCSWQRQPVSNLLIYSGDHDFWTKKRSEIIKQYREQYDKLITFEADLKKVKREKAEAEAKNLWDQV